MVQQVECSCRQTHARCILVLVGGNREVVSPTQIQIHIRWSVLGIATDAVRPRVEERIAVEIGAGRDGPWATGIGEDAGRNVVHALRD